MKEESIFNKCQDCVHFLMDEGSVKVDLTGCVVTATAVYVCDINHAPEGCKKYTRAYIEDIIFFARGTPRGNDAA
jgi:hypothetical protein